ncbi:unnamed protein product [Clavelina lepadiformis]|uniref:TIR domain-containing protein n=1 Tax=Clavelina lepadiformis TaxID=159417 RepID=A0ABP0FD01_CLALP
MASNEAKSRQTFEFVFLPRQETSTPVPTDLDPDPSDEKSTAVHYENIFPNFIVEHSPKQVDVNKDDEEKDLLLVLKSKLEDLYELPRPWENEGQRILNLLYEVDLKYTDQEIMFIGETIVECKFIEVCNRIWDFCHSTKDKEFNFLTCKAYQLMKSVLFSFSDKYPSLAKAAYQNKTLIERFMSEFDLPELSVDNLRDDNHIEAVECTMCVLLNMARNFHLIISLIRRDGGLNKILNYYQHEDLESIIDGIIAIDLRIAEEEKELRLAGGNHSGDDETKSEYGSEDANLIKKIKESIYLHAGENSLYVLFQLKGKKSPVIISIGELMVEHKFIDVCVRIWDFCHNTKNKEFMFLSCEAYRYMKSVLLVFSDKCPNLAKAAYENKIFIERCMSEFDSSKLSVNQLTNNKHIEALHVTLSILLNMLRHLHAVSYLIRCNGGLAKILKYYEHDNLLLKTSVIITVAHCINDEENDKILAGTDVIAFIAEQFKSILDHPLHQYSNLDTKFYTSAIELVIGLDKLAANENNKKTIVDLNVLPLLKRMLATLKSDQMRAASHCIWTLSFLPANKDNIREEPNLLEVVHHILSNSEVDSDTKRSCDGIIFNIEKAPQVLEEIERTTGKDNHIMISYQWNKQPTMLKLRDCLNINGFKTWVDVDKMQGSILEEMAHAVEDAGVIVIAMTEDYKKSNACRTEAEYAYKLKKPIIPLLLESGYNPDGWLGALLGTKLYVDLSNEYDCLGKFPDVIKMIQTQISKEQSLYKIPVSLTVINAPKTKTSDDQSQNAKPLKSWKSYDVKIWAEKNKMADIEILVSGFDGVGLLQLYQLLKRCPEIYYTALRNDYRLEWLQVFHLTEALETLNRS